MEKSVTRKLVYSQHNCQNLFIIPSPPTSLCVSPSEIMQHAYLFRDLLLLKTNFLTFLPKKCQQKGGVWEDLGQGRGSGASLKDQDWNAMVLHTVLEWVSRKFRKTAGTISCSFKKTIQANTFDVFKGKGNAKEWGDSCLIAPKSTWTSLGKQEHHLKK